MLNHVVPSAVMRWFTAANCRRSLWSVALLLLPSLSAVAAEPPTAESVSSGAVSSGAGLAAIAPSSATTASVATSVATLTPDGLAGAEVPTTVPVTALGEDSSRLGFADGGVELAESSLAEPANTFQVSYLAASLDTSERLLPMATDLAQVTRVTDFSDVLPSDWAFQALSGLVENYGCIQGYPDRTFRGQRSITRFEFAAGLNACLDVLATLIGGVAMEDLEVIRRLQDEFAVELASLDGRVDLLEAEVAELRSQQFATQTKLRGSAYFNLGTGFTNGAILAEGINIFAPARDGAGQPVVRTIDRDPGTPFGGLTWINMDTSFTGADRLKLQFTAGSGSGVGNLYGSAGLFNTFGVPFTFQGGGLGNYSLFIRELSYQFPLGDSLTVDIGPRINWYGYFDQNRYTFFGTGANSFNSSGSTLVNSLDRGAGVIAVWDIANWLDLRVGYLAENNEFLPGTRAASDPTRGLFGGTNTLTGQIGLRPFNNLNLRFLYTRSNIEPAPGTGFIGGSFQPIYGFADDGFGGPLTNAPADTFVVNFDWTPASWLGLFGRYSYGSTQLTSATTGARVGDVNAQAFQFGLAFPDLFKEGALATLSYVIPFDVTGGREFLISGGGDGGTQQELELSYRYPLTRNIALMPSAYWIMNANNFGSNPDIFIFNLQTQFSF